MKTPYCAAIGVQRREVDQIRISISEEVERLTAVERRRTRIDLDMRRERSVAAGSLDVPNTAYFLVMRAERMRLEEAQRAIDARVTELRSVAREAYGSLNAVEGAAERYRDHETRRLANAEQSASDDRSAAIFAARNRLARAAGERRSA